MTRRFVAQTLVETKVVTDQRRIELTFADAGGVRRKISLPAGVAADLIPVLASLAGDLGEAGGPKLTKLPRLCAVGRAQHERLVLIRFDDDPPYGLDIDEAENLWREVREETEQVAQLGVPARH